MLFVYMLQILGVVHHQAMEEKMRMKRITTTKTLHTETHVAVLDLLVFSVANSQASSLEEEMETGCKNQHTVKS